MNTWEIMALPQGDEIMKNGKVADTREADRILNNHERLVQAFKMSMLGLEAMIEDGRCGDTFTATALHLDNCNALLASLEAEKGGEL